MKHQVTLKHKRSTPNTHLFVNDDSDVCTAIYLKKARIPVAPSEVTITIESPEVK